MARSGDIAGDPVSEYTAPVSAAQLSRFDINNRKYAVIKQGHSPHRRRGNFLLIGLPRGHVSRQAAALLTAREHSPPIRVFENPPIL
jgi:hypothetical protein